MKNLAECEAARISDLELIEKLEAQCIQDLERHATAMIASSVSGQCRLAKKLDAFLTSSRNAMLNLELKVAAVFQRLGLDWKLDGNATADSADVGSVRSSHQTSVSHKASVREKLATTPISAYLQPLEETPASVGADAPRIYTTPYFPLPDSDLVFHGDVFHVLRTDRFGRLQTVVQALKVRIADALTSPFNLQFCSEIRIPFQSSKGSSRSSGGGVSPSPSGSPKGGPPFPSNPPGEGGGGPPNRSMANPQGNLHQSPFTKHSYPKFKAKGYDDDADSYIKLFESVSTTNKENNDAHRMRIFPSLLRKKAGSWYNRQEYRTCGD
ncbi:hypothetical protein AXG93_3348s1210 [Marchantia polymorpha subsp. ruderalis]|uniref:Uncharacterized protein n=1 Tax=Marchantia polymorpha subsp. ruderalis TaxID=1480154 RepID=A0A176VPX2_MARPO|nr:hypothetical protein AXG93_3348s1210 [Marchantia polymorpha subsp. ruderalis]